MIQVLEQSDTPEARQALEAAAPDLPEPGLIQEARAALERLAKRSSGKR